MCGLGLAHPSSAPARFGFALPRCSVERRVWRPWADEHTPRPCPPSHVRGAFPHSPHCGGHAARETDRRFRGVGSTPDRLRSAGRARSGRADSRSHEAEAGNLPGSSAEIALPDVRHSTPRTLRLETNRPRPRPGAGGKDPSGKPPGARGPSPTGRGVGGGSPAAWVGGQGRVGGRLSQGRQTRRSTEHLGRAKPNRAGADEGCANPNPNIRSAPCPLGEAAPHPPRGGRWPVLGEADPHPPRGGRWSTSESLTAAAAKPRPRSSG